MSVNGLAYLLFIACLLYTSFVIIITIMSQTTYSIAYLVAEVYANWCCLFLQGFINSSSVHAFLFAASLLQAKTQLYNFFLSTYILFSTFLSTTYTSLSCSRVLELPLFCAIFLSFIIGPKVCYIHVACVTSVSYTHLDVYKRQAIKRR